MTSLEQRAMSRRELWILVLVAAVVRCLIAWQITGFVLVDDAYITLRYARNAAESGALVYNCGEAVFGVTSPLWGFVTYGLYELFGRGGIEVAVIASGIVFWSAAALRLATLVPARQQRIVLAVFLWAPVFVDNQMLGMETPLFAALAVFALGAAHEGRVLAASVWTGWLVLARPEGVLFAPALVWLGCASSGGARAFAARLGRPWCIGSLLVPGLAWVFFATSRYGTVVPQSMVAKSGWNSEHYESLGGLEAAWFGLARLTFVPFVDYLPSLLGHGVVALLALSALFAARAAFESGRSVWPQAWIATWALMIAFYLAGKGATEASWYAVPPSIALLVGAGPLLEDLRFTGPRVAHGASALLCASSIALSLQRAPLLHSYVEGYGRCAASLEASGADPRESVLIGEIGVFGFETAHRVIDVGALVSPEVLPLKNARLSLVAIAKRTCADWLVVSDVALETNHYPSVGEVWSDEEERAWLRSGTLVAKHGDKRLIRLLPAV